MSRRLATVDVGSSSVTALFAEERDGAFVPLAEEAVITRLGRDLDATGRLSDAALDRTLEALAEMAERAKALGTEPMIGVATAAAREAGNGDELVRRAAELGIRLEIVTGETEAQLSWLASWRELGEPGRPMTVVDVGGRSTEVIHGDSPSFSFRVSLPVGAVRLTEAFVDADPPSAASRKAVAGAVDAAFETVPPSPPEARIVAVAGTATTLAAVHLALPAYDAARVHGLELSRDDLEALVDRLWSADLETRRALPGMEPKRADVIPAGALLLLRAVRRLGGRALTVSDRGVRWGLLYRKAWQAPEHG